VTGSAPAAREWGRVAWLAGREAFRAAAFPLRLAASWPAAAAARAAAATLLAAPYEPADAAPPPRPARARPLARGRRPRIFLSTGDVSGETHALRLLQGLARAGFEARWLGLGGQRLAAAGMELLADLTSEPVMGLGPVLARLPFFMRTIAKTLALFRRDPPDLAVLLDSPGLNILLGEEARRRRIPVLYYITPQYWAWASWRMARFRRAVDGALCIFPFEPALLSAEGVPAAYVGHPAAESMLAAPPAEDAGGRFRGDPILALLPGSRSSDVRRNLPAMVAVFRRLAAEGRTLRAVVAEEEPRRLAEVEALLPSLPGGERVETTPHLRALLGAARLALVKSGTASLETALAGTPAVVCYVLGSRILYALARHLLAVPWVAAANLVAAREVVPERLLLPGRWEPLFEQAARLWDRPEAAAEQRRALAEIRGRVLRPGSAALAGRWVRAWAE